MEFTKITRSLSYEMVNGFGLKLWDKLGAEMEVSPTDNPKEGYSHMKMLIEEVHKESFPGFESILVHDSHEVPNKQVDKPKMSDEEELIQSINKCASLEGADGLLSYRIPAASNPSAKSAYDLKLKLLKK
jgi:hypothetical protein